MLLQNVHRMCLDCPPEGTEGSISAVIGPYDYWHYLCDGFDDRGWGCGYRTLQTIVSWIKMHFSQESLPKVEHIHKYQAILNSLDQPIEEESRDWIGTVEAGMVIDMLYNIPCKFIHCKDSSAVLTHVGDIITHFNKFGAPLMMGGERDHLSKGIFGVARSGPTEEQTYLLIVDPHYASETPEKSDARKFIYWKAVCDLDPGFYNLMIPMSYDRLKI